MRPPESNPLPLRVDVKSRHKWMAPYQYSTETASTIVQSILLRGVSMVSQAISMYSICINPGLFVTVRSGTAYRHLFSKVNKKIICNVYY